MDSGDAGTLSVVRNRYGRITLVVRAPFMIGALLFLGSFWGLDFLWTHFAVTHPSQFATTEWSSSVAGLSWQPFVGSGTLGFVLNRFWPRKQS